MSKYDQHQFELFGFLKPAGKVPISADRIKEAKKYFSEGRVKDAEASMREVREALEDFESRLFNKQKKKI